MKVKVLLVLCLPKRWKTKKDRKLCDMGGTVSLDMMVFELHTWSFWSCIVWCSSSICIIISLTLLSSLRLARERLDFSLWNKHLTSNTAHGVWFVHITFNKKNLIIVLWWNMPRLIQSQIKLFSQRSSSYYSDFSHRSSTSSFSSSSCMRASSSVTKPSLLDFWEPSRWATLDFKSLF